MYRYIYRSAGRTLLTFQETPRIHAHRDLAFLARGATCQCGTHDASGRANTDSGFNKYPGIRNSVFTRALVSSNLRTCLRFTHPPLLVLERFTMTSSDASSRSNVTFDPSMRRMSHDSKQTIDKRDSDNDREGKEEEVDDEPKPTTAYERLKKMWKSYWYVVLPVHLVTSGLWFGSFYLASRSGIDIVELLNHVSTNVAEYVGEKLAKSPRAQHLVVAYALYKIASPFRYMVTLGGTTLTIRYLSRLGLIRPVPSRERMREMASERWERFDERRGQMKTKLDKWREKRRQKRKDD